MSDNTSSASGDTISTDDLSTINGGAAGSQKVQRVKVGYGIDGDFNDVSTSTPLPTIPDGVKDSAVTTNSVTSATTVISASTTGYCGGAFHVSNAGTGCTVTYEQSNDNTNWVNLVVMQSSATTGSPGGSSTTSGMYTYSAAAAYVRARVSTYGSGTVTISFVQKRVVPPVANVSLGTGGATVGNVIRQSGFSESGTPLAASATFNGTGRTSSTLYSKFNATAASDQAGTLYVDLSTDTGATYKQIASQALTAGSGAIISVPVTGSAGSATLYRARYVNGGTLQGVFQLTTSFTAA